MFHIARRLACSSFCFSFWFLFTTAIGALRVEPPCLRDRAPLAANWESRGFECLRPEATAEDWIHCRSILEYSASNWRKLIRTHRILVLEKVFNYQETDRRISTAGYFIAKPPKRPIHMRLGGVPCPVQTGDNDV